jgi:hypothetical protein
MSLGFTKVNLVASKTKKADTPRAHEFNIGLPNPNGDWREKRRAMAYAERGFFKIQKYRADQAKLDADSGCWNGLLKAIGYRK